MILIVSIYFSNSGLPPKFLIASKDSSSFWRRNSRTYSKLPALLITSNAYFLTSTAVGFWLIIFSSCRLLISFLIAWIIGNENFPSVRSSQKPLFWVYWNHLSVVLPYFYININLLRLIEDSCNRHELESGCQWYSQEVYNHWKAYSKY